MRLPRPTQQCHLLKPSTWDHSRAKKNAALCWPALRHLPGFVHGNLEIRQEAHRREKRIRIKLLIQISRLISPDITWAARTADISSLGARIADASGSLKLREFVVVRYGTNEAVFRVIWLGLPETPTAGHVGVECLSPETNIWDFDLSARTDDGPLFREIVVARAVQHKFVPREKPRLGALDYSGKCIQARTVGGGYYDFLDLGAGHAGFVLADAASKGVAAALLMANVQGSIHNHTKINPPNLPGLLSAVNAHLYEHTEPQRYATVFFRCLRTTLARWRMSTVGIRRRYCFAKR